MSRKAKDLTGSEWELPVYSLFLFLSVTFFGSEYNHCAHLNTSIPRASSAALSVLRYFNLLENKHDPHPTP